ncbi:hypothetical protein QUF64_05925 [Anaerolineales bacterium HSG6]|nr:hypothetical protein [Anaerolineales bacterium HSG6]MDM8531529.1 hypothetical protein [Anaerolineales bacterium HSG25]
MTTKLKIDLTQGVLEVEGSETFVRNIYNDFKTHFVPDAEPLPDTQLPPRTRRAKTKKPTIPEPSTDIIPETTKPAPPKTKTKSRAKTIRSKNGYTLLTDLDLTANSDHLGLMEFTDFKFPITNEERNLVFVYYLKETLGLTKVTADHIFTCYKEVHIRAPVNIENSLEITAEHRNWISISKTGALTLTRHGKKYVEERLPVKK